MVCLKGSQPIGVSVNNTLVYYIVLSCQAVQSLSHFLFVLFCFNHPATSRGTEEGKGNITPSLQMRTLEGATWLCLSVILVYQLLLYPINKSYSSLIFALSSTVFL